MYHSINIDEYNTWDDWHLIPMNRPVIAPPKVNTNQVDVPGMDGFIDFTELLTGRPTFSSRTGSWEFAAHPSYSDIEPWNTKLSSILRALHGVEHRIILEDDPAYYYLGRLNVKDWKPGNNWSTVNIEYALQPYKREILSSSEDWLWDPFSFVDGIIRAYSELAINGSFNLEIRTGTEPIVPEFVVTDLGSDYLTLTFEGKQYKLYSGTTKNRKILLTNGDNQLSFNGTGKVTINFKAGWL